MSSLISKKERIQLVSKERKDCVFICGEDRISAHKLVLSYVSPVFEKMFYGRMASSEIKLLDINPTDLKQVIDYIYSDTIKIISVQNAWALIYISQKYFIKELLDKCICYVTNNLSVDNLLLCFEYAQLYNIKILMDNCLKNIQKYCKGLLHVNYHMQLTTLHLILSDQKLFATDSDLILLVVKWAIDECEVQEIEPNVETLSSILNNTQLLKDLNLSKFNRFDYNLTENLLKIDSYSNLNQTINLILHLKNKESNRTFNKKIPTPQSYHFRLIYKISRGYFFSNNIQIINDITISRSVYLFGLAISSLHQPAGVDTPTYDGTIDVRITQNKLIYYSHRFKLNNIAYNDIQRLSFPLAVKLEGQKIYSVIITYFNENPNAKGQVVLHYCAERLVNKQNLTVITFSNELEGSVLQGVSYLIA